ncbi:hypothetical protein BGZ80_007892 [Entomortierella chlamydospora]|uniref:Arm-like repeat domain-containing protein n=1 Tax=Entomortierella chlamydospora TaxID=101097 RepID=A0A9P6T1C6_9FUNG|nr:hypothetical protein BGZ80_007892 [Entomortierella chlamydospora]
MVWFPFSSPLTLEEILNDVDRYLEKASKEIDPMSRLKLCRNAKAKMKDARKQLKSKDNNQRPREGIAQAYFKHSILLESLGKHAEAQKSKKLAKEWGYDPAVSKKTHSSILGSATATVRASPRRPFQSEPTHFSITESTIESIQPSPQSSIESGRNNPSNPELKTKATHLHPLPTATITVSYDNSISEEVSLNDEISLQSEPTKTDHAPREIVEPFSQTSATPPASRLIFASAATPLVAKHQLPRVGDHIKDTYQLAYCLNLMDTTSSYRLDLDQALASDIVRTFIRDGIKGPDAVKEIVCLAPVLEQEDFRRLLHTIVDGIKNTLLQDNYLLDGLAQMIRNSSLVHLDVNDLVKILKHLSEKLQGTHWESAHQYHSVLTISRVLDVMMDTKVKGVHPEDLHSPFLGFLKELRWNTDPYLAFQSAYAYQALLYIPDDESTTQEALRRTGKVVQGISGIVSAVKAVDINRFVAGLDRIQNGLALVEGGQNFIECIKEGFSSERKSVWYPALRGLDIFIQEGQFTEFETLIRVAPCRKHPLFQWGICQRLGKITNNRFWDTSIRNCAIKFLFEIYEDDTAWNPQPEVKQWILYILNHLEKSSDRVLAAHTRKPQQQSKSTGQAFSQVEIFTRPYPIVQPLQPNVFPLLSRVQAKPKKLDVEIALRKLRDARLNDQGDDIYVNPKATTILQVAESSDLMLKTQEFLRSEKTVLLLRGGSGSGKSTFNRALEVHLWETYKADGDIPLFIELPAIEDLKEDLVVKQLHKANFTDNLIKELKEHRHLVLNCDGYDESQLTENLYVKNRLNQIGEWRAKVVITRRTEYMTHDYKGLFLPTGRNHTRESRLFEEVVIAPFDDDQIREYIEQYALNANPPLDPSTLMKTLKKIPDLQDLVKTPFILKNSLEILPQIEEASKIHSTTRFTRVEIYDNFVFQWLERNQTLIQGMKLGTDDVAAFLRLLQGGFTKHGFRFLPDLAAAIYTEQEGNPVVHYSRFNNEDDWKSRFFINSDGKDLLRGALPLTCSGDYYRFIHASYLEYGLSLAVFDPKVYEKYAEPSPIPPPSGGRKRDKRHRNSINSTITNKPITANDEHLVDSPLGKIVLTGNQCTVDCLEFLVQRVQQYPILKAQLLEVIGRSKFDTSAGVSIAASNAITILVKAGVDFIGADLRNVRIPKADLTYGVFDSAQLDGADLQEVSFRNAWLCQASLRGAQMKGAQFGELQFIKEDSPVRCCAYSPDGKTFAAGLDNGDISLYQTSSWDCIHTLAGHDGGINSLSFSATSDRMASGSNDNTVRLWDVDTGECIYTLQGHSDYIRSVIYSPRGDQIASGSSDFTVRLWDVDTGECRHSLKGHSDYIRSVVYSPKGDRIASGSNDSTVRLWNIDTGECIHVLQNHKGDVNCVVYSPKRDRVASGSSDSSVRLWDAYTGECIHILQGHSGCVGSVTYSPEGNQIASGSYDSTVRLWDVRAGKCTHTLQGHSDYVRSVTYSPEGGRIISGGYDSTIRLWDVDTGGCLRTLEGHNDYVHSVIYSPNGDRIASGSSDMTVRLWDVDTGECIHTLKGHNGNVCSVVYSTTGDRIASGSGDKTVRLWDVDTGECIHTLKGHSDNVCSVAYSPKGDRIASGSSDKTVRLWDVDTDECIHTLKGHSGYVASVVYSPKGDRIASGSYDKIVRLWDADTGTCIHTVRSNSNCIRTVVFSPKGDRIASGSYDKTVRLWDADTGTCIHILEGHSNWIRTVVYSPKGDQVASGSDDNTVRLWDADTGECIHTLRGHSNWVRSVVYSPEGDWIASGGDDRTLRLWDVGAGECLATVSGFSDLVSSIAFESNSGARRVVTGSFDKSVRRWRITKVGDVYKATLCWSSSHEVLTVYDLSLEDVRGLSRLNQKLLIQNGALIPKPLSSSP